MIISLNWLKKFTNIDLSVSELATLIGARLVEIEETIGLAEKYDKVVIVKVVKASKLEGSNHLSLTKIDDGGVTADVERDENGYVQVVCGAPNIKTGQMVVWLPPNSIVPETFNSSDPFKLGARKLCGTMSNGMIASAKELDLFDEHEGILVVGDDIAAGTSLVKAYELDDYLLDIENKSLTHRPDCFGIVGFAREIAAIQGNAFKTPEWLVDVNPSFEKPSASELELNVQIDNPELSSRYQAVVMSGADGSKQSSLMTQIYLSRVGIRPISAVVDATNYLMLLTGQPLHAFDYDKVVAVAGGRADIHVRSGKSGEKLTLLDGRTIVLTTDDIVIAAGETAIGLAGAMGGANTEIDVNTKNIIIESATFNLYNLRATQMRHGIFSEAITRFTKGQPAELTAPVLSMATKLMKQWAGAECVSQVAQDYSVKTNQSAIKITNTLVNDILGSNLSNEQIINTLKNVEFKVEQSVNDLTVMAPYWRADIHINEDVVEEIGRLNGFDNINPVLPKRDFVAVRPNEFDLFRTKLRQILVEAGANEVLSYSFIHGDMLQKSNQATDNSYKITNSISPDLQYYRQSLTPNLLNLAHPNIKQGFDKFALFEINKSHNKLDGLNDEAVPVEAEAMALMVVDKNKQPGAAYYQAKRIFDYVLLKLGVNAIYGQIESELTESPNAPFEYRRSAMIIVNGNLNPIGVIGEYKKSVMKGFKLPDFAAGFEIKTRELFEAYQNNGSNYKPISRYPASERDICFQVDQNLNYSQIIDAVKNVLNELVLESAITPIDIYKADGSCTKNITIRIKLTSHDHTLAGDEISDVINKIASSVVERTNAKVI